MSPAKAEEAPKVKEEGGSSADAKVPQKVKTMLDKSFSDALPLKKKYEEVMKTYNNIVHSIATLGAWSHWKTEGTTKQMTEAKDALAVQTTEFMSDFLLLSVGNLKKTSW